MKQSEKTALTISKILSAAIEEFGVHGYSDGSINRICRHGIQKGLIYHNFKDKDTLYLACVQQSCEKILREMDGASADLAFLEHMKLRMQLWVRFPLESHIFFEALLSPPEKLIPQLQTMLEPWEAMTRRLYYRLLPHLTLRTGVSEEEALQYFSLMQQMFNWFFTSARYQSLSISEKSMEHESQLPKLTDFMLYGVAQKGEAQ
ncbi:MAG: TetR/AcrR family transcriptional regulator [Peptoniphilaceae bacterium]|nr:TetR/AcrR family transcriptional regulator [Peptoniphilaceae bacterium]